MATKVLRVLLPLAILAAGLVVALVILGLKPEAKRKPPVAAAQLVELRPLRGQRQTVQLSVTGVVTPRHEVRLMPEVGGKVTFASAALVPGGRVKKGEVLVRIDPREYSLQVEQLRGQISSAALAVEQEQAQQDLARYEWQVLGESGAPPPLFSRKSQKAAAESTLAANKSALSRAQLNLSRTTLRAPFDATVISKGADVGQVVGPQTQLAHLVGTEEMWVLASVAVEDLDLITIPSADSEATSAALIVQNLARGKQVERTGQVTRLVQQLDERTRRAQVVITVPEALDTTDRLPLLPGAHVEVSISGKQFDGVFTVPREAVYEGDTVWIAEGDGELRSLQRRSVEIGWGSDEQVFVTSGLTDGDQLVVTPLSGPVTGANVRPMAPSERRAAANNSAASDTAPASDAAPAGDTVPANPSPRKSDQKSDDSPAGAPAAAGNAKDGRQAADAPVNRR